MRATRRIARTALAALIPIASGAVVALVPAAASAQVDVVPDVVYGHKAGMALTYDVLRPTGPSNGAGVAYMVSGGWVSRWSEPEEVARRDMFAALAERGFTVYLVRHGSSPRFKVPEALADVREAIEHIRAHASEHGVDPDRIGITGMSAGGHLSLSIGLHAEGLQAVDAQADDVGRPYQVAAVVAYFPPVDLRDWVGPSERFPALEFEPALAESVSPILFASNDDPPTLLLHGDEDGLVPLAHSERMHEALSAAGVETELHVFEGAGHGFRGGDAERGVRLTVEWFERHLTGGSHR